MDPKNEIKCREDGKSGALRRHTRVAKLKRRPSTLSRKQQARTTGGCGGLSAYFAEDAG
ncbi:MAG: hypothetical protein HYY16_17935 [Planctomycetes bacterium]|nr:hypothetical protein [Planctomycetota bacterium]